MTSTTTLWWRMRRLVGEGQLLEWKRWNLKVVLVVSSMQARWSVHHSHNRRNHARRSCSHFQRWMVMSGYQPESARPVSGGAVFVSQRWCLEGNLDALLHHKIHVHWHHQMLLEAPPETKVVRLSRRWYHSRVGASDCNSPSRSNPSKTAVLAGGGRRWVPPLFHPFSCSSSNCCCNV